MKKIRNKKQLKRELDRLRDRQLQLEDDIRESWRKIRKSIRPQNVAKDVLGELVSVYF